MVPTQLDRILHLDASERPAELAAGSLLGLAR